MYSYIFFSVTYSDTIILKWYTSQYSLRFLDFLFKTSRLLWFIFMFFIHLNTCLICHYNCFTIFQKGKGFIIVIGDVLYSFPRYQMIKTFKWWKWIIFIQYSQTLAIITELYVFHIKRYVAKYFCFLLDAISPIKDVDKWIYSHSYS